MSEVFKKCSCGFVVWEVCPKCHKILEDHYLDLAAATNWVPVSMYEVFHLPRSRSSEVKLFPDGEWMTSDRLLVDLVHRRLKDVKAETHP